VSERPPLRARVLARLRGPGAWRAWLGLVVLGALTAYALYRLFQYDLRSIDVGELLSRIALLDIGLASAVYVAALALAVVGWGLILGTLSGYWAWLDHARIYCATQATRRLPGTYWYVLGRVVMYERLGVARGVTALAGGLELASTCIGGLVLLLLTWPLVLGVRNFNPAWFVLGLAVLIALLNPPAVRWMVRKLSPHSPAVRYRHILLWSLVHTLVWALGGAILYVLAAAVDPSITPAALPAIVGVWVTTGIASITLFSFLPFGFGATEVTIASLLGGLLPPAEAIFVAFAMRALLTICELLFGLGGLLVWLPDLRRRGGTGDQPERSLSDAENLEGVFEPGAVVPRKEAGFSGK
jgi:uncharacterized membrane protein YbhN (UPF0104 family)